MEFILEYLGLIIEGLVVTVEVTIFGAFIGLALGTLLAVGDLYGGKIISSIISLYVEFFRGSPILIQLSIFYYTIPSLLNIKISGFTAGLIVFALNSAAYQKGYMKGALEVISEDQMMAALSVGLSKLKAIIYVLIPQALRIVIPAWSNEFCSLTKSTSALLSIAVRDLTMVGLIMASHTWRYMETFFFIAIAYLIWITAVTKIADKVYERVKIPGIEISA